MQGSVQDRPHPVPSDKAKERPVRRDELREALRDSQERFHRLFEYAPVALWHEDFSAVLVRMEELRASGVDDLPAYIREHPEFVRECAGLVRVLDANLHAVELHRAPNKAKLIESIDQTFTEESFEVFGRELQAIARGERVFEHQATVKTLDGERLDVLVRVMVEPDPANASNAFVAITDISELERRRRALAESEETLRTLVTHSRPIIFMLDREGTFVLSEGGMLSALGLRPGEVVGRSAFEMYADHPDILEGIRRALAGEVVEKSVELGGRWFEVFYSPWKDAEGQVRGVIGMGVDVTDRVVAERERAELEKQVQTLRSLEAISSLAGGVAHDFNNMLQAILGYTDLCLDRPNLDGEVASHLHLIRASAERAATLTSQLLAFGRRQVLETADFELNELVAGLETLVRRLLGEHTRLVVSPDPGAGTVHGDRGQLEQAVMNLVLNARDAMPKGGHLWIETHRVEFAAAERARRPWAAQERYSLLVVRDDGIGMSPEVQSRVFEPFFSTKEGGRGTGLGLATVFGVVRQHGGMIEVSSSPGAGTEFRVFLPTVERPAPVPLPPPVPDSPSGGSETILVAEDEEAILTLCRTILERAGYTVRTAENGEDALAILEADGERIDTVLLDLVMPRVGGHEVMERSAKALPHLKFLFMTGYDPQGLPLGDGEGASHAVLRKPFEGRELLAKLRRLLDAPADT